MIEVFTNPKFISEKKYIFDYLLNESLGLSYHLNYNENCKDYRFQFNDQSIIIKDCFFSKFKDDLSYLSKSNIPKDIKKFTSDILGEKDIPVLFGNNSIIRKNDSLICEADIIAGIFFMLTRWEEYVINDKDKHGRLPDNKQLAIQNDFFERPVVNEYINLLLNIFKSLDYSLSLKSSYKSVLSHDVDFFERYKSYGNLLKAVGGDILKRKSFKRARSSISDYQKKKKGLKPDPYDTFDYIMNVSDKNNLKSTFYFIALDNVNSYSEYSLSNKRVIETINNIKSSNHNIGIHGSYYSYNNSNIYKSEISNFPPEVQIIEGRQHFLRFDNPISWRVWEEAGIKTDSTIGYIDHAGFRAGVCNDYPVFDIINRCKLKIRERPLIVMETALKRQVSDVEEFYNKIIDLNSKVRKYKGKFVLLWHNSNFYIEEWEEYSAMYEEIIEKL